MATAVIFVAFLVGMGIGIPIAAALLLVTFVAFQASPSLGIDVMTQRTVAGVNNFILLAIPLFVLTGSLMNATGMSKRLFALAEAIVGHLRGGLAQVNVLASVFMGGISGSSTADAAMTARVLMPPMARGGYSRGFAGAITAGSAMVSPVLPPSIAMILYGTIANVSLGAMFIAGIVPGVLLGGTLAGYVWYVSRKRGYRSASERASLALIWKRFRSAGLGLLVPVLIIGGIRFAVMTPTEAGAVAVVYVLLVGLAVYRQIRVRDLYQVLLGAVIDTGIILIIIAAASPLAFYLTAQRIPQRIAESAGALSDNPLVFLLMVNLFLLAAGALIEATALIIMVTPVLAPMAVLVGVDLVHFGVVMIVNVLIGTISPPFGQSVFVVSAIGEVPAEEVFADVLRMLPVLLAILLVLTYAPDSYLWVVDALRG